MQLRASLILILTILTGPSAWAQSVRDFPPPRRVAESAAGNSTADADNWYPTGRTMPRPIPLGDQPAARRSKAAAPFPGASPSSASASNEPSAWWGRAESPQSSSIQQASHQELVPGIPAIPVEPAPRFTGPPARVADTVFDSPSLPAPQRQQYAPIPLPETPPVPATRHLTPPPVWNATTGNTTQPVNTFQVEPQPVIQVDTGAPVYAPPSFPSPYRGDAMQTAMHPDPAMYSDPALAPPPLWEGELHCDSMGCDYAPGFHSNGGMDRLFDRDGHGWFMPFIELQARSGNNRSIGAGSLFAPLWQNNDNLLFFDMRGEFDDLDAAEGNWGLGYRRMMDTMWIFGVHAYLDVLHSKYSNDFAQGTLGFEFLTLNWDFRLNGYIPSNGEGYAPTTFAVSNGNIVTRNFVEKAYGGFDFETGYRVGHWGNNDNVELRWFVGGFVFDASGPGYDAMVGPKTRIELRLYDLDILGYQARLEGGAEFTWDDVRNEQSFGFVRVRIPLGSHARDRLGPLRRRMADLPVRNID